MNFIYTRPTDSLSGAKQNKAILAHFASEWNDISQAKRYAESRLKMAHFEQMLDAIVDGDIVYCYSPSIFGIGVEQCCESIRALHKRGALIRSVVYGVIEETDVCAIEIAGEIVRECCSIEQMVVSERNKGVVAVSGGYFDENTGQWREGMKRTYEPPQWSFISQRKADKARQVRDSSASRKWIEAKIMDAWTTEMIWKEYKILCKLMEEDVWERVGKHWINVRRLELTK